MHIFSHFLPQNAVKTTVILAVLAGLVITSSLLASTNAGTAQGVRGPTKGERFVLFNAGGQVTKTMPLGTWAFCMLSENKVDESGEGGRLVNHSCRIDGSLNNSWTLVSYVGNHEDGQCSAFCVGNFINPVGTIIGKATINGVEQPVSFIEDYTQPNGSKFSNVTLNLPATFTNMPAGTWKIDRVAPLDSSLRLTSITGCGNSLPCSAQLAPGGTITVTYNFVTLPSPTGTIILKAYKDGVLWDAPAFTVSGSSPLGPTFILDFTADTEPIAGIETVLNAPTGAYTIDTVVLSAAIAALSPSVTLKNINGSLVPPSYSQTLSANGTITLIFNFVTAVVPPLPVPTFVVSPTSASVSIGGVQQFYAIYDPDGTGPQSPLYVTNSSLWSSSNNSVATVNSIGSAVGASAGSATLTAQYSGLTASASLTVTAPTPTLVVSPSSASVAIGGTKQFTATYDPDGSGPNPSQDVTSSATWSSSDASKVTVSGGLATRVGHGITSVSVSYSGLSRSATILDPASVRVVPSSATLDIGETIQLSAMFDPDGPSGSQTEQDVTTSANWSSNRPSVASVDNASAKGLTRAIAAGPTTRITASYNVLSERSSITVTAPPPPPPPPDPELLVSCSASPALTIIGQPVVWTAVASGGTGSYSSLWSGNSPLSGKTSNPITVRYSTTGTKTGSVRVTSGSKIVTQSCSTSVTVETPPPPPTATLSASLGIIDKGNSSTLSWLSTNADSCTAMGGFDTEGAKSGSKDVSPSTTSDYQISCEGPGGLVNSNFATVTVISATASISASPSCVQGGGSTKISWSATQVASCDISGPGLSSSQISGSQTVNITGKSTYTIACRTNGGSTVTKQVIVDTAGCWSEF